MRRHCFATTLPCFDMRDKIYSYYDKYQTNKEKYNLPILLSLPLSCPPLALISSVWRKRESAYIPPLFLLNFYFVFLQFIYSYFDIYSKTPPFGEIVLQFYIFVYFFWGEMETMFSLFSMEFLLFSLIGLACAVEFLISKRDYNKNVYLHHLHHYKKFTHLQLYIENNRSFKKKK